MENWSKRNDGKQDDDLDWIKEWKRRKRELRYNYIVSKKSRKRAEEREKDKQEEEKKKKRKGNRRDQKKEQIEKEEAGRKIDFALDKTVFERLKSTPQKDIVRPNTRYLLSQLEQSLSEIKHGKSKTVESTYEAVREILHTMKF